MKKILLVGTLSIAVSTSAILQPLCQYISSTLTFEQKTSVAGSEPGLSYSVEPFDIAHTQVQGSSITPSYGLLEDAPSSSPGTERILPDESTSDLSDSTSCPGVQTVRRTAAGTPGSGHIHSNSTSAGSTASVRQDTAHTGPASGITGEKPSVLPGELPSVKSYENLKRLLEELSTDEGQPELPGLPPSMPRGMGTSLDVNLAIASATDTGGGSEIPSDYSETNVQVEGVDEADIVKTDGTFIYQVNRERVVIIKAVPSDKMQVVGALSGTDSGFVPQELYVDQKHLVVIGAASSYRCQTNGADVRFMPRFPPRQTMKAVVYDIEDKSDIRLVREFELNGAYVSSRKIGQNLYLIARRSIWFYHGQEIEEPVPSYRDSLLGPDIREVDYPEIRYFPDFNESSYLIIGVLSLEHPDEAARVSCFLGSSQNIYASARNLYVAVASSRWSRIRPGPEPAGMPMYGTVRTKVYKFGMDGGHLAFASCGKVPGTVLNQFSMDEHDGFFRIATTQGNSWRTGAGSLKNNVYIFDSEMNVTGKLEDIAPGERIYSARFMRERGYLVTFRTVDPFFVLDLKEPANPCILGELKIPGYSNYLHPYDEKHVIGFGKDAVEVSGMAFYMGMKMALFDVSDVRNPVEKFSEKIGDRGTDSELLRNHKALLFSKDRALLAFPVKIFEVEENESPAGAFPACGSFSFQGAYVYSIDLFRGFVQKGKITHRDGRNNSDPWYCTGSEKDIERILYVDDTLYTLSKDVIKANAIDDLKEIDSLEIK